MKDDTSSDPKGFSLNLQLGPLCKRKLAIDTLRLETLRVCSITLASDSEKECNMFPHSGRLLELTEMHQEDLIQAAERHQLVTILKRSQPVKPKLWTRLVWRIGAWLVVIGHRLQAFQRQEPDGQSAPT